MPYQSALHATCNSPGQAPSSMSFLLWGGATSSHLNSLGSIQAMRLPLGAVNLSGMHILINLPLNGWRAESTLWHRHQFSQMVIHWSTNWVHGCLTSVTDQELVKTSHTKSDLHIALLQIRQTPLSPGLPSPATLLFDCPIRGIMPILTRLLLNLNKCHGFTTAFRRSGLCSWPRVVDKRLNKAAFGIRCW